ncbi:MAG: hypothetical protein RQ753_07125 [Desulfurivibrionaceae bacterium]|nr:hypothetical protein [Desulfobulbales bacterium]MDT8335453.1 hypothetical protein [Desulfurivibrionaceae bacterium]
MKKGFSAIGLSSLLLAAGLFLGGYQESLADQGRNLTQMKMKTSLADLQVLEAEFYPANNIVSVKGMLKNTSNSVLRGFLSLHILSATGHVLQTFELPLKDNQPLNRGESVSFETVLPVAAIKGAAHISVDFTKN